MDAQTLISNWEQAEISRSSTEASRVAPGIRPTPAGILARYARATLDTPFPLEYAYALAGDVKGLHVLDYGCGTGADSVLLAARGAHVSAMDISPDLLALASRRAELDHQQHAIVPLCGSAHAIPLPDASVDLVFGNAILHHLDLALTAGEVHRVLKPGGRAIFKEPIRDSRTLAAIRRVIPYRTPDVSPFERPLRRDELGAFASRFARWHSRDFELPFVPLGRLARLPRSAQRRLQKMDARLLQQWPKLGHFASIQVFEVVR